VASRKFVDALIPGSAAHSWLRGSERVLCVRFDQLELWKCVLVGCDLVAVLDFVGAIRAALLLAANGFHYFTLNAGTAPPFSMNVHLPSAHTRFSISIRFNWTYCSGDRPIACR